MRRIVVFFLCAGICLAGQRSSQEAVKKELNLFQGKWKAVSAQALDGKPLSDDDLKATSLVVEGDKFILKTGNTTIEGTFSVDPAKKIKTIDVFLDGSKDNIVRGIYEIGGDTRKSCFAEPGKDRPDGFRKEKGYLILEWKRAK